MLKPRKAAKRAQRKLHGKKVGLPPGSLVYVGEETASPSVFSLTEYDADGVIETRFADLARGKTISPSTIRSG